MSTITFNRADPDENFPILRFVSEDGSCEVGLTPMLFGVRVRASMVGAGGVDIDYCAGADQLFQLQLLDVIKRIIETFPIGTTMGEINKQLPTYKRRPIDQDPCWPALQQFLEKRIHDGPVSPTCCPNCGGTFLGDGYQTVRHCENADDEAYFGVEPDAGIVLCRPEAIELRFRPEDVRTITHDAEKLKIPSQRNDPEAAEAPKRYHVDLSPSDTPITEVWEAKADLRAEVASRFSAGLYEDMVERGLKQTEDALHFAKKHEQRVWGSGDEHEKARAEVERLEALLAEYNKEKETT